MALAVDIDRLLKGGVVEWRHIDFKKNFHPLPVLRNICAFANDIDLAPEICANGFVV